ncbi:RNA methyltransferase [Amphibiibacter pelophylacis]|uniref:RNA methyltransferase n=1 Tax=Amphibiibacter pelophylacis TaxID=1799477 RepID=A0ACC6P2U9_9BURK
MTKSEVPHFTGTRFVLVKTSHAGNVGAAARALKVMGFDHPGALVLVQPRWPDVLQREEALALASGATDVLAHARVVDTLQEALQGVHLAAATAMTPRDFGPPTFAPRALFSDWAPRQLASGLQVAFVFGSERFGLANEDVYRCHACVSIPTAPGYGSLNLAQAVQLLAYDWREALGSFPVQGRTTPEPLADSGQIDGLMQQWQQVLLDSGFLDPASPRKIPQRLHQWLLRSAPSHREVQILRGLARAVLGKMSGRG